MARIVIIQHQKEASRCHGYSLQMLINRWKEAGHRIAVMAVTEDLQDADLAIMHVNLSHVPQACAEVARKRYPRVVNIGALDIRKRNVSRNLLARDDDWPGPVIAKSDFNCGGVPEWVSWKRAKNMGHETGAPPVRFLDYAVYRRLDLVPEEAWSIPEVVVERFLPERVPKGFCLRTWIFFGDHERCRRFLSPKALVKGADYLGFQCSEVPEFLRAERERLGFEYGKFDFVMHEGKAILLDANKTPGIPPEPLTKLRDAYANLAGGLDAMLK